MTEASLYDAVAGILGGPHGLLDIAVVQIFSPCETDSVLAAGRHRTKDGQAITTKAQLVDVITENVGNFLSELTSLKQGELSSGCTCTRRGAPAHVSHAS